MENVKRNHFMFAHKVMIGIQWRSEIGLNHPEVKNKQVELTYVPSQGLIIFEKARNKYLLVPNSNIVSMELDAESFTAKEDAKVNKPNKDEIKDETKANKLK